MGIKLVRIDIQNAEKLWKMQVKAFQKLYEKYQDTEIKDDIDFLPKRMRQLSVLQRECKRVRI